MTRLDNDKSAQEKPKLADFFESVQQVLNRKAKTKQEKYNDYEEDWFRKIEKNVT